jgi:hypothetical protein
LRRVIPVRVGATRFSYNLGCSVSLSWAGGSSLTFAPSVKSGLFFAPDAPRRREQEGRSGARPLAARTVVKAAGNTREPRHRGSCDFPPDQRDLHHRRARSRAITTSMRTTRNHGVDKRCRAARRRYTIATIHKQPNAASAPADLIDRLSAQPSGFGNLRNADRQLRQHGARTVLGDGWGPRGGSEPCSLLRDAAHRA